MNTRMKMAKDGADYRLVQIGLEFYLETEAERKCVDSAYIVHGWTREGRVRLTDWLQAHGYAITWEDPS